ncbi:MAG: DNA polymerase III subunit gamma/tau [Rhodothermales bacterium]|nr:DNA polymerase III subunit gamma/tau [Rhodothermales bacterium]
MADAARPDAPAGRYLVTARKYRPQTFADLVSQEHVTGTLQNALLHDRLAHAYLFSGPRGVGKTTAARLLAKAINCQTPLDERDGAEPCRTCERCRAFEAGRSLSILEIDAASNNKVEDVREIRETVLIPPQGARKKVYIVDEVHMLSNAAFNALLKTLEEPPPHALFIFATTEPHKVLPTILSRCQRFDFRRITVEETVGRLRAICEAEHVEADDASLHLIARKGDGALRDALSVFDQSVSLCGTTLRYPELAEALGVVDRDLFFEVADRATDGDGGALLTLVDGVVRRGYDLQEFLAGLAEHLRNLYAVAATGKADLVEADEAARTRYAAQQGRFGRPDLLRALMVVDEAEREIKASPQPRLKLELALLKLAHLEPVADLQALIGKLERLEAMAARGDLPTAPAPTPESASEAGSVAPSTTSEPAPEPYRAPARPAAAAPEIATPTPATAPTLAPTPEPQPETHAPAPELQPDSNASAPNPSESGTPGPSAPASAPEPRPVVDAHPDDDDSPPFVPPPERRPAPPPTPTPDDAAPQRALVQDLFGTPALKRKPPSTQQGPEAGDGGLAEAVAVAAPTAAADPHFGVSLGRIREAWPKLVQAVRDDHLASVAVVLAQAEPAGVEHGAVQVAVADAFTERLLRAESGAIARALGQALGEEPPPLAFVVQRPEAETAEVADPFERIKQLRHEHPVVRVLFERFGGEIVWT